MDTHDVCKGKFDIEKYGKKKSLYPFNQPREKKSLTKRILLRIFRNREICVCVPSDD